MKDLFFDFFTRERKNISQNLYGEEAEPFKTYPDMPSIRLEKPTESFSEIDKILEARESANGYTEEPVPLEKLSNLLHMSVGLKKNNPKRRRYPSGGAKYPIDIYLLAQNVKNLEKAIYYYTVKSHSLVKINDYTKEDIYNCFSINQANQALFKAPIIIFMTFSKNRSMPKYGALAYKLGLIEIGHIGQNIYLTTGTQGLSCRAHAGGDFNIINNLLNIDGIGETAIHTMSVGFKK